MTYVFGGTLNLALCNLAATVCQTSAVASVSRQRSWAHSGACENAITSVSSLKSTSTVCSARVTAQRRDVDAASS